VHEVIVELYRTRTNFKKKYGFAARVINDWNSLPSDIVMATNFQNYFMGITVDF